MRLADVSYQKREEAKNRRAILQSIEEEPKSFTNLLDEGIVKSRSQLTKHLRYLESQGIIKGEKTTGKREVKYKKISKPFTIEELVVDDIHDLLTESILSPLKDTSKSEKEAFEEISKKLGVLTLFLVTKNLELWGDLDLIQPFEMDMRVLQDSLRRYIESKEEGKYYNSDPEHFNTYLTSIYINLEKIAPEDIKNLTQGVDKALKFTKS